MEITIRQESTAEHRAVGLSQRARGRPPERRGARPPSRAGGPPRSRGAHAASRAGGPPRLRGARLLSRAGRMRRITEDVRTLS